MTILLYPRKRKPPVLDTTDCLKSLFSVPNSERLSGSHKLNGSIVTHGGQEDPVDVVMPSRLGSKRDFLQQLFGRKNRGGLHEPFSSEQTGAAEQIFTHGLTAGRQPPGQQDIGRFAPLDETARNDGILERGLLRGVQLDVELVWKPFVVMVEKGDPSTSSYLDSFVASLCRSQIARQRLGYYSGIPYLTKSLYGKLIGTVYDYNDFYGI